MKAHYKTWRITAGAGAPVWRALAEQAKKDPKLAALLRAVAEAMEAVERYLAGKEEQSGKEEKP
jgi:hypothetical protein